MTQVSRSKTWPMISVLFACATFFGAVLLFFMEPLVGKSLLPHYGGTPAVWNTCVFFFQAILLLGYVYAHLLQRYLTHRAQLAVHILMVSLALLALPIHVRGPVDGSTAGDPIGSLLVVLTSSVGFVFFIVSTTAPLMQAWFATARPASNPYLLYVASNAGSLVGLLIYPLLLEVWLPLSVQFQVASWSFAVMAFLIAACAWSTIRSSTKSSVDRLEKVASPVAAERISAAMRFRWFILSLCPSSLMLSVTTFLSSEIAPIPVIWMLPLSVYLVSFMIAFSQPPRWLPTVCSMGYVVLAVSVAVSHSLMQRADLGGVVIHNGLLFLGAVALHSRLASLRPQVSHLTEFYLWISAGGLCGSLLNTLLAPLAFNWLAEYPLMIAASLWLLPWPDLWTASLRWRRTVNLVGQLSRCAVAAGVFVGLSWTIYFSSSSKLVLHRERTFFGSFYVERGRSGVMHQLVHGTTVHGMQIAGMGARERSLPLTYYFPTGPIAEVFRANRGTGLLKEVGIVGLGVGALAGYAESGQNYTFYEIDPAIERVAQDPRLFSFLKDAEDRGVQLRVVLGDARLKLRESPDAAYSLLVLDAFTSDCVPVHLLTREAISEYVRKLRPDGVMAFHISNNYIDLEPILASAARELGLVAFIQRDTKLSEDEARRGKSQSIWLIMAASEVPLRPTLGRGRWQPCRDNGNAGFWTDDQSSLLWEMLRKR